MEKHWKTRAEHHEKPVVLFFTTTDELITRDLGDGSAAARASSLTLWGRKHRRRDRIDADTDHHSFAAGVAMAMNRTGYKCGTINLTPTKSIPNGLEEANTVGGADNELLVRVYRHSC